MFPLNSDFLAFRLQRLGKQVLLWAIVIVIVSMGMGMYEKSVIESKDCSYFDDWVVKDVPVRCLSYYQNK